MKNEFVPYDIALAMKELGFDEPCLFRYTAQKDLTNGGCYDNSSPSDAMLTADEIHESHILAPLYQQLFRWFREVHNIEACVSCFYNDKLDIPYEKREYHAFIIRKGVTSKSKYKTYEEAEIACLRKLIEIVKEKQHGNN